MFARSAIDKFAVDATTMVRFSSNPEKCDTREIKVGRSKTKLFLTSGFKTKGCRASSSARFVSPSVCGTLCFGKRGYVANV